MPPTHTHTHTPGHEPCMYMHPNVAGYELANFWNYNFLEMTTDGATSFCYFNLGGYNHTYSLALWQPELYLFQQLRQFIYQKY